MASPDGAAGGLPPDIVEKIRALEEELQDGKIFYFFLLGIILVKVLSTGYGRHPRV